MKKQNKMEVTSNKVKLFDRIRIATLVGSAGCLVATALIGEFFKEELWYEQLNNTVLTATAIFLAAAAIATFLKMRSRKEQERNLTSRRKK